MEGPDKEENNDNKWNDDFGGFLRFECPVGKMVGNDRWCENIRPSFNTALFFRTRPRGPVHEVMPVSSRAAQEGYRRFAVTGWYMDPSDTWSSDEKAELDKMKGIDEEL
mmetsp:Transcript_13579/g.18957  ORF Transcript_13579/g.18957 Transcript_13579/m.18957 type:complete len:109 (+) Transcript_13579:1016-1342(+)